MIHPSTKISVVNIETGEDAIQPIASLFQSYADRIIASPFGLEFVVEFDRGELKIMDNLGWTDVISITKRKYDGDWRVLSVEGIDPIIVTPNTLIPAYNPEAVKIGFHGTRKYELILKNPEKFTAEDCVRVRQSPSGEEWFHPTVTSGLESVQFPVDMQVDNPEYKGYAFQILTMSKFCNCGKISMFAEHDIPVSEAMKWYQ